MGYGRIFMANKKEINRNNNNKTIQNNNNKNSLLCPVVAFFFNFIRSPHSVISIIPFYHFFDEFSILMFQMNNSQMTLWLWFCKWMNGNAPAFLSFLSVNLIIHSHSTVHMHHLYLTSRAMIRFVCSHCLGIRRLRVGPDYQRFNTRFSSSAGQCDALSNGNRREICKGSGTDNYYSAQISGKPLQDSSQIFPRMEKHASCSAYNEVLLAG